MARPTKYDKKHVDEVIAAVERGASIGTAAHLAGLNPDTVYEWQKRHAEFSERLTRARAIQEQRLIDRIDKAGIEPKHWQANLELMKARWPKKYQPRIVVQVEEELSDAVRELEQEFGREPEILDRALAAIERIRNRGHRVTETDGAEGPAGGADHSASGEAVHTTLPKPEAGRVPTT